MRVIRTRQPGVCGSLIPSLVTVKSEIARQTYSASFVGVPGNGGLQLSQGKRFESRRIRSARLVDKPTMRTCPSGFRNVISRFSGDNYTSQQAYLRHGDVTTGIERFFPASTRSLEVVKYRRASRERIPGVSCPSESHPG